MDLQFVKNQSTNSADIFLFDTIGGNGIKGQTFVNELQFLDTLGLDVINVRINSGGGSVIEGFSIFSAIRAMKTPVNTITEGIAASIAGIIAMAGRKRLISDFGRLMIHDPAFSNGKADDKTQKVLDSIKASLITILTNNSLLDAGEIFNVMTEETWYTAEEAVAFGFMDEMFSTQRAIDKVAALETSDILNIANELLIQSTTPIQTIKTTNM